MPTLINSHNIPLQHLTMVDWSWGPSLFGETIIYEKNIRQWCYFKLSPWFLDSKETLLNTNLSYVSIMVLALTISSYALSILDVHETTHTQSIYLPGIDDSAIGYSCW